MLAWKQTEAQVRSIANGNPANSLILSPLDVAVYFLVGQYAPVILSFTGIGLIFLNLQ